MIRSFKHRGLKALYLDGSSKYINPQHTSKLRDILAVLDQCRSAEDANLPGFRLHTLTGKLKGHWSIAVSGNWRVIFRIEDGDVVDVDYLDYH